LSGCPSLRGHREGRERREECETRGEEIVSEKEKRWKEIMKGEGADGEVRGNRE